MSLGTKIHIVRWKVAGNARGYINEQLNGAYSQSSMTRAWKQRAQLLARAAGGASDESATSKTGVYPEVDARLHAWCLAVRSRGRKRVPLSLAILRSKALQIAASLGVANFWASNGYLKNWARRYNWGSVALHGTGASANVEEAATRMADIRRQLEGVDPDLIYNVDETGPLYRCLPSRCYVPSDNRQQGGTRPCAAKTASR